MSTPEDYVFRQTHSISSKYSPTPTPKPTDQSGPSDNRQSITKSMSHSHLDEQHNGGFNNTQNPLAKNNSKLSVSSKYSDRLDELIYRKNSTNADEYDEYGNDLYDDDGSTDNDYSTSISRGHYKASDIQQNQNSLLVSNVTHSKDNRIYSARKPNTQNSIANRAIVNTSEYSKSRWPGVAGAAAGGALLYGTSGAAAGAVIGGGVIGVTALGSALTGGLIGAAAGSTVPVVGTIIGAAVGVGIGLLYASFHAVKAKGDYLDTTSNSWANSFQRDSKWAWARAMNPASVARGLARKLPFVSGRRAAAIRTLDKIDEKLCCCIPLHPSKKKMNWEERGTNATQQEAQINFRYAVAADAAYYSDDNKNRINAYSDSRYFKTFIERKDDRYGKFKKDPKDITLDEIKDLITPPKEEMSSKKKDKHFQTQYKKYFKLRLQYQNSKVYCRNGNMGHEEDKGWTFEPIGNGALFGTPQNDIFENLNPSIRKSLSENGLFRDPMTGNNIRINYDSKNSEVVIGFNGTAGHLGNVIAGSDEMTREQNRTNVANYLGGVPPSVKQAAHLGADVRRAVHLYNERQKKLNKNFKAVKVVSVGHSRGGMLAQAEAIKNGGEAVTFNTEPLGPGVRNYCGVLRDNFVPRSTKITNFSVRNEKVSGSGIASGIGNAWETVLGLPTPVIYGERKILKQAPNTSKHPDPINHMAYLAGTGDPAKKALFSGKERDAQAVVQKPELDPNQYREDAKLQISDAQHGVAGPDGVSNNLVEEENADPIEATRQKLQKYAPGGDAYDALLLEQLNTSREHVDKNAMKKAFDEQVKNMIDLMNTLHPSMQNMAAPNEESIKNGIVSKYRRAINQQ